MQQLYINGKAVDMPAEEIRIKVDSNLFADVGNIMTAHSYSITLPRTMRNDSLLRLAYLPTANTGGVSTHTYLSCALHIDGIPLFEFGRCVITEVGDKGYKCNLFWGLLNLLESIKDEGLDLCDLVMSKHFSGDDLGVWIQLTQHYDSNLYVSGMSQALYTLLDDDSKALADRYPWGLPVISANDILQTITDIYGLQYDFSQLAEKRIDKLYHPLTSLKSLAEDEEVIINLRGGYRQTQSGWVLGFNSYPLIPDTRDVDYSSLSLTQLDNPPSGHSATNKWQANNSIASYFAWGGSDYVSAHVQVRIKKIHVFGTNKNVFSCVVNGESVTATPFGNIYRIDHTFDGFTAEAESEIVRLSSAVSLTSVTGTDLNVQIYVDEIADAETGMWWNDYRNLPKVGVIDYLDEILAHIGGCIIGTTTKRNVLRIVTFDEVAGRTPESVDIQGIKSLKMSLDNLAQKNIYTHEDNEDTGTNYKGEGYIYTDDNTLAVERTAFDSNFRVPKNTIIRLWALEPNGEGGYTATWAGGNDYICGYDSDAGTCRNTGQGFAETINNYYTQYSRITSRPKEIEAVVRLSIFDLISFDFEKPLYINQLGAVYLVKSLENEGYKNYKIKLVQI